MEQSIDSMVAAMNSARYSRSTTTEGQQHTFQSLGNGLAANPSLKPLGMDLSSAPSAYIQRTSSVPSSAPSAYLQRTSSAPSIAPSAYLQSASNFAYSAPSAHTSLTPPHGWQPAADAPTSFNPPQSHQHASIYPPSNGTMSSGPAALLTSQNPSGMPAMQPHGIGQLSPTWINSAQLLPNEQPTTRLNDTMQPSSLWRPPAGDQPPRNPFTSAIGSSDQALNPLHASAAPMGCHAAATESDRNITGSAANLWLSAPQDESQLKGSGDRSLFNSEVGGGGGGSGGGGSFLHNTSGGMHPPSSRPGYGPSSFTEASASGMPYLRVGAQTHAFAQPQGRHPPHSATQPNPGSVALRPTPLLAQSINQSAARPNPGSTDMSSAYMFAKSLNRSAAQPKAMGNTQGKPGLAAAARNVEIDLTALDSDDDDNDVGVVANHPTVPLGGLLPLGPRLDMRQLQAIAAANIHKRSRSDTSGPQMKRPAVSWEATRRIGEPSVSNNGQPEPVWSPQHKQQLGSQIMLLQFKYNELNGILTAGSMDGRPLDQGDEQKFKQGLFSLDQRLQELRQRYSMCQENLQENTLAAKKGLSSPLAPNPLAPKSRHTFLSSIYNTPAWASSSSVQSQASSSHADHQAALKAIIANLNITGEEGELDVPQDSMTMPIMRHQKMALAWMCKRETGSRPRGGILADDQGLGKTVSTIALILTHTPDHNPLAGKVDEDSSDEEEDNVDDVVLVEEEDGDEEVEAERQQLHVDDAPSPSLSAPAGTDTAPSPSPAPADGDKPPGGPSPSPAPVGVEEPFSTTAPSEMAPGPVANLSVPSPPSADAAATTIPAAPLESITSSTFNLPPALLVPPTLLRSSSSSDVILMDCSDGGVKTTGSSGKRTHSKLMQRKVKTADAPEDVAEDAADADLLPGGTLVVCPTSVLHQWAREIRDKVNPITTGFSVHVYHGKDKAVGIATLSRYSVVLTTYGTLATDAPAKEKQLVKIKKQGSQSAPINLVDEDEDEYGCGLGLSSSQKRSKTSVGGLLFGIKWHRVVLDEAQSIKNPRTLAAHAAWSLSASHRWCLSGTPIQNTVDDLYSYFKFLRFRPYCEAHSFKELLKNKIAANPVQGYKLLSAVLQSILLRRTKQTKIQGEPVVKLPPREQEMVQRQFSLNEQQFYGQLQDEGLKLISENEGGNSYVSMLYQLLKLRQACNHPWLVKGLGLANFGKTGKPSASEISIAKKLPAELRTQLVASLLLPQAMCPVCADMPEAPVATACGHVYCKQCVATQLEGAGSGEEFLCCTCSRVLRSTDVFTRAALEAVDGVQAATSSLPDPDAGARPWVSSSKVDQLLQLLESVRSKNKEATTGSAPTGLSTILAAKSKTDARMVGALRKLPPVPCGGSSARNSTRPEKVIVFSQWTGMLDLLEIPLKKHKFGFRRLDGTMTVPARERSIGDFEEKPEVMVLLVSLKAAALGVNLTVANHVVLMDLWWNPTVEEQAIDRAHRIGQTRTVHVTRITIKGSVEDRILELQDRKRKVVASVLNEGGSEGAAGGNKLTADDLRFLFGIKT